MKFTDRLYRENKELWSAYLVHPFIEGMKNATLSIDSFKYYMIQDYHYLIDYTKVFAIGLSKAKTEEYVNYFSNALSNIAWETTNVHRKYMERLGITEEEIDSAKHSFSNTTYTSYMLTKANENDDINALAAVLSCSWSYAFIGKKMLEASPDLVDNNIYGEWVKAYSGDDFQNMNEELMKKFDERCEGLNEERLDELSEIFKVCSECEYRFWDMAYSMGKSDIIGKNS